MKEKPNTEAVGSTDLLADFSSEWRVEPDYSGVTHKCGLPICDIRGHKHNRDRAKKNARLIAASPAMLRLIESLAPLNKSAHDFLEDFNS